MAANLLRDNPELRPFLLSNVRLTGTRIGAGAYGSVEEVAIPGAICAAKKIHEFFQDLSQIPAAAIQNASTQFVRECQLMSTLAHRPVPGRVLLSRLAATAGACHGATADQPSRLAGPRNVPSASTRRAETVLPPEPEGIYAARRGQRPSLPPRATVSHHPPRLIGQKRSPELGDGSQDSRPGRGSYRASFESCSQTKAPGANVYMPPEALEDKPETSVEERDKVSKYDASIDIFSFGVVAIFTLSQTFPCKLLAHNYRDSKRRIIGRSELERREHYMRMIYSQLHESFSDD